MKLLLGLTDTSRPLLLAGILLLSGCGGGGSSGPTPQPTPPTPPTPTPQPTPTPPPAAPLHIGDCRDTEATAELTHRVAALMGLGDEAIRKTHIYCDPWTPGPDGRNFQTIALASTGCTADNWSVLFGCANGVGSPFTGIVSLIRMSPDVMAEVLRQAREQGLSTGPHSDAALRCMWSLRRTGIILIHEWHHAWFGLSHEPGVSAEEMFAEDDKVKALLDEQHGEWLEENDWAECPLPQPTPTPTPTPTPQPTPTPTPTPTPQPTPTPTPQPTPTPTPQPPDEPLPEPTPTPTPQEQWLQEVNLFRSGERTCGSTTYSAAAPFRWNDHLESAAMAHSLDMASNNFVSHTGSNGSGFASRVFAAGYRGLPQNENIAAGTRTGIATISGWKGSPGHCAALMSPTANEMGMAGAYNPNSEYGFYWTFVSGHGQ